jgi:aromatic-L-amino-acid decarboxylase
MTYPLEPSPEQMLAMGDDSIRAVAFLQGVGDAPASDYTHQDEVVARLREPAPEFGTSFQVALETIVAAAHVGHETSGPGFLGFIPGGGLYASSLADLLADTFNRFVNLWQPAPGFSQIEATAVRWMQDLFDHPPEGRGVLTTGGSMANLGAIVTARRSRRTRRCRRPPRSRGSPLTRSERCRPPMTFAWTSMRSARWSTRTARAG